MKRFSFMFACVLLTSIFLTANAKAQTEYKPVTGASFWHYSPENAAIAAELDYYEEVAEVVADVHLPWFVVSVDEPFVQVIPQKDGSYDSTAIGGVLIAFDASFDPFDWSTYPWSW